MLVNLTRCMRHWDDLSVTQLLLRRMGHLERAMQYALLLLSVGLTYHFSIKSQKTNRICCTIFSSCCRICRFNNMLVLCGYCLLLSYKQLSLAYSNICYLLWSHVEYRVVFFIIVVECFLLFI